MNNSPFYKTHFDTWIGDALKRRKKLENAQPKTRNFLEM